MTKLGDKLNLHMEFRRKRNVWKEMCDNGLYTKNHTSRTFLKESSEYLIGPSHENLFDRTFKLGRVQSYKLRTLPGNRKGK